MDMKGDLCAAPLGNSDEKEEQRGSYGGFLTLAFSVDPESGEVSCCYSSLSLGPEGCTDIQERWYFVAYDYWVMVI